MEHEYIGSEDFLDGVQKITVRRQPSSKQVFGCGWTRVLDDGLPVVGQLPGAEQRLWWYLTTRMNVANRVLEVPLQEIATRFLISKPVVSRSLARLRQAGVIRGKANNLMLSPRVVYKGQTADYAEVVAKWDAMKC